LNWSHLNSSSFTGKNLVLLRPEFVCILAHRTCSTASIRTASWAIFTLQVELLTKLTSTTTANETLKAANTQKIKDAAIQTASSIWRTLRLIQLLGCVSIQPARTPETKAADSTVVETTTPAGIGLFK